VVCAAETTTNVSRCIQLAPAPTCPLSRLSHPVQHSVLPSDAVINAADQARPGSFRCGGRAARPPASHQHGGRRSRVQHNHYLHRLHSISSVSISDENNTGAGSTPISVENKTKMLRPRRLSRLDEKQSQGVSVGYDALYSNVTPSAISTIFH